MIPQHGSGAGRSRVRGSDWGKCCDGARSNGFGTHSGTSRRGFSSRMVRLHHTNCAYYSLILPGFSTITSTAVLFAKTTLHMPSSKLIVVAVITPLSGVFGSLAWPLVQKRIGWSDLRMVKLLVVLVSLIPLYGCLGFLPAFREQSGQGGVPFGGLTTPGEMYGLAVFFGTCFQYLTLVLKSHA
jgi:Vacuole effluxer Atg22 like